MLRKANNKCFQHWGAASEKHFYNCVTLLKIISCVNKNVVDLFQYSNVFTDNTGIEKNHQYFCLTTDVEPPITFVTSYKVICNPIVFITLGMFDLHLAQEVVG